MKEALTEYIKINESALSTTEIIKDSFKNAFLSLDANGFVIIKNNRRKVDSVLIDLKSYTELINKIEILEEEKLDAWASNLSDSDYEFIDSDNLDF